MADSAEIVEPTSPTSGAAGPARSAGPDRPAAAGASIRLDNLTKRYPDSQAPAVENVTRNEAAGETVIPVGPSGCGKSTTLKMINRLIEPTSGQSTIGGEDVTGINPVALRRTIGYAIQVTGLFPRMTVTENIGLVAETAGPPRAKVRDRGEEMSNTVAGPRGADPAFVEAARGIGVSPLLMLFRGELPLAVPLILAGVRTAIVLHVGTAMSGPLRWRRSRGPGLLRHRQPAHAGAGARLRTDGRHDPDHGLAGDAHRVAATPTRPGGGLMRLAQVRTAVAGALLLAAAGLSGCGLTSGSPLADSVQPGSIGKGRPLEGAQLTVTSKEFTEQIILGQIMGLVFKAAGAQVLDRTNIQGSIGAREAVKSGAADGMYEYTGTAWITYLGHTKRVVDPYEQWEAVREEDRRNGITWLSAAPLNNTYALVANQANAQKYRLRTLSDVARLTKEDPGAATICGGSEFSLREDGLPGVAKTYGFALRRGNFKKMDDGVVYTQVAEGAACALGVAATTDGRIPELKLKVLEDDRHFFPNYNAAPEMNSATMRKYPAIADLLSPITKRLTGAEAQRLNARVDVDGEDPHEVAKDWLVREGFIREG
ncbi:hypothetical protein HOK021_35930 [Streptomyces hygroscopicus]|nr:hypothetical protein HOK021_35930 [Streptomyces hygroscopicus]